MSTQLIIVGAGEFAMIAYEYFTHDSQYEVVAFAVEADFKKGDSFLDKPLLDLETLSSQFSPSDYHIFVAVSFVKLNRVRARLFDLVKSWGYTCASYVSSRAFKWHNVELGENCFVFEHNTLQPFVKIGNNVILWSGNHIGHQTLIEDHCFISSHVVISGFCKIGAFTFMGVNTAVADEVAIAQDNFIAMGTAIHKNTEPNKIYKGIPGQAAAVSATQKFNV
ncbi:MAG: acetyltransferase [Candidatus Margulisiibacteriota bacterium]